MDGIYKNQAVYSGEGRTGVWHLKGIMKAGECLTRQDVNDKMPMGIATVEKVPLYAYGEPGLDANGDPSMYTEFPRGFGTIATWKDGSKTKLGVVGEQYEVCQDTWLLDDIPSTLIERGEAVYDGVMYLHGACVFVCLLKLPDDTFVVDDGGQIEPYLLLVNSHDGSSSLKCMLTTVRVVCHNTLTLAFARGGSNIRITHSGDVKAKAGEACRVLGLARNEIQAQAGTANRMARRKLTQDERNKFIIDALGIDVRDPKLSTKSENIVLQVLRCLGTDALADPESAWGMLNAVTSYVDHHKTVRATVRSGDTDQARVHSTLLGPGQAMKAKAWEVASQLVSV